MNKEYMTDSDGISVPNTANPPQFRWIKIKDEGFNRITQLPNIQHNGYFYVLQQLHYEFDVHEENGHWLESRTEKWVDVPVNEDKQ